MSKNHGQNLFGFNGVSAMKQRGSFALIMAALILTAGYNAQGQTFTNYLWNNSSTIYASGGSWTNGVAPSGNTTAGSNNIIEFSNLGVGNNTVSLSSNNTVGTILFSSTANPYTFESTISTVRLSTMRGMTNNSTTTQTFNLLVDTKENNTWYQAAGGSMIFNTNVGLASIVSPTGRTLTLTGGGTFDFKAGMTGGTGTGGKLVVNNSGGTVNLSASNLMTGMTLTAGALNINNNNALGLGAITLNGGTINNTSGAAIANSGNNAVTWGGDFTYGTAGSTSTNNLNLGTGVVATDSSRTITFAGTDTKLTMGSVNIISTNSTGRTITANGAGNTLEMGGLSLSASATPVTVTLAGTANLNVTGAIVSGTAAGNGLTVTSSGTNTFSGNNTYTGSTEFGGGTNIISGDNRAVVGNVSISGSKTIVRLDNNNAISSSSSLLGTGSGTVTGVTLDLKAAGDFTFNSYGTAASAGANMAFTNSSGSQKTVTFTNINNYITSSSAGARTLANNSSNLLLDFDGNIQIGSTTTQTMTFTGAGNFNVDGNLLDTGVGGSRTLNKKGDGTLTLRGSGNNYRGSTTVDRGRLDLYGNVTVSTNITVSTDGTVSVASVTRPATATLDVKSGATLLTNSTTTVYSGGNLVVNGTAGGVILESNGLLGGSGTVGNVNLKSGAFLTPGNSPGLLTASSASWATGSTYQWQIDNATGTAGTNWDLFSVTGALDMSALSSSAQMNLVLESLSIANYSTSTSYSWVIAKAASFTGITNGVQDLTSYFNINSADFNGGTAANLPNGGFQVVTGTEGGLRTLNLMAVPEPSTGALLGFGLGGLVLTRLLRRKQI